MLSKTPALLATLVVAVCASAQAPAPQYGIKAETPLTGSAIRRYAVSPFNIPINQTYEQLSPADRLKFHGNYEAIASGDEPPFPAQGLVALLDPLRKAQQKLLSQGELFLAATVDGVGKVTQVEIYGAHDKAMADFATQLFALTAFKPAKCGGQPCTMQFPLRMTFRVE